MKKVAATSGHKVNLADGLLETDEEFDDAALFGSKGGTLAGANFGGVPLGVSYLRWQAALT